MRFSCLLLPGLLILMIIKKNREELKMKKLYFFTTILILLTVLSGMADKVLAQDSFYKVFPGSGDDMGNYVSVTTDGGFIVVGKTNSKGNGDYDVWLVKTDASGNIVWDKTYGGSDKDEGLCVQQTSDGGYVVAANSIKPGHFNHGWIFKTDAAGMIKWNYKFGGDNAGDAASFVLPFDDGTCIVSGTNNLKSFVAKLDTAGHELWSQVYFMNLGSTVTSMCNQPEGRIAVAGTTEFPAGSGLWYPNLFYIEGNGDLVTQLTWTNYPGAKVSFVSECNDGGLLMGGSWNDAPSLIRMEGSWNYGFEYSFPYTGSDISMNGSVQITDTTFVVCGDWFSAAIMGINDDGEQLWSRYGRINEDDLFYTGMQKVDDNHLIFTGYRNEGDVNHDVVLVKTYSSGSMTGVQHHNNLNEKRVLMQNSPNPFSSFTTFTFTLLNPDNATLSITGISGKTVKTLFRKSFSEGEHRVLWDGTTDNGMEAPDGVYFAVLKLDSGLVQTIKLVKQTR